MRCRAEDASASEQDFEAAAAARRRRGHPMVLTNSARCNLEAVALALCQGRPLLLEGRAGQFMLAMLELHFVSRAP